MMSSNRFEGGMGEEFKLGLDLNVFLDQGGLVSSVGVAITSCM
jgi:hypothetical protein